MRVSMSIFEKDESLKEMEGSTKVIDGDPGMNSVMKSKRSR